MHILFIADASSPHSYRWVKYFAEVHGNSITWCSFTENTMPKIDNVEFKKIYKNNPLKLIKSIRYISKKSPDIIHVHYLGWNGLLSLFFPKIPTVLTAWGSDIVFNSKNWSMNFLLRKMIKKSILITCDAIHLKERMIELGSTEDKIKIIMFGIDENLFLSKRKPFDYDSLNTKFVVGSIRNLHPVYDIITLLKAARIVLESRKDVIFNIAGTGPDIQMLERFADKNNLADNIKFIGRLDSSKLLGFYDELDIYVSTSLSDGGIASSTAEAMLCSRPVVITDAAENSNWVENSVNGLLFDCGDYSRLALIILELLDNQEDAKDLGIKAKETIMQRNLYSNEMNKMQLMYKKINENSTNC
jgi:L-malate glycosyltransferase